MPVTHPLEEVEEQLTLAFEAIDDGELKTMAVDTSASEAGTVYRTRYADLSIEEMEDAYIVRVGLPGLDPDELDVQVSEDMLIIADVPFQEDEDRAGLDIYNEDEANIEESELTYGEYVCEIPLPGNIDTAEVVAEFVEDRLEVQLPKILS